MNHSIDILLICVFLVFEVGIMVSESELALLFVEFVHVFEFKYKDDLLLENKCE